MEARAGLERLRRLPGRWSTYAWIVGSAAALLTVGLVAPLATGHAEHGVSVAAPSSPPPIVVADHDGRPAPRYGDAALVVGARPSPEVRLTASDVGVTPTTITIGVVLVGLGAVSAFGIE